MGSCFHCLYCRVYCDNCIRNLCGAQELERVSTNNTLCHSMWCVCVCVDDGAGDGSKSVAVLHVLSRVSLCGTAHQQTRLGPKAAGALPQRPRDGVCEWL